MGLLSCARSVSRVWCLPCRPSHLPCGWAACAAAVDGVCPAESKCRQACHLGGRENAALARCLFRTVFTGPVHALSESGFCASCGAMGGTGLRPVQCDCTLQEQPLCCLCKVGCEWRVHVCSCINVPCCARGARQHGTNLLQLCSTAGLCCWGMCACQGGRRCLCCQLITRHLASPSAGGGFGVRPAACFCAACRDMGASSQPCSYTRPSRWLFDS
jgi:hypothetical protein